jgi:enoyl-CoA hydratase
MSDAEVLFERRGHAGIITLNRPKALNALTLDQVRSMTPQLKAWAVDDRVHTVVIRSAGDRAFSAGGDVRALYESGRDRTPYASQFWAEEYRLDTLIKEFPKPYVALIQGLVMGGGVGVSFNGSLRVVCETTTFAMPETGIGLFPDVGGTFFLPRLAGRMGLYLALTGARLKAPELRHLGLATHIARFDEFDTIVEALADKPAHLALRPWADGVPDPIEKLQQQVDYHFGGGSVEAVLANLDADSGEWAQATANTIRAKSPTSLKIAFRQMEVGLAKSFRDCMAIEFRLTERIQRGTDFYEGVRATIIDKDGAPKWRPATLEEVKPWIIDDYFAPLAREWTAEG